MSTKKLYPVYINHKLQLLTHPIYVTLDADVAQEFESNNVELALAPNGKGVLRVKQNGHHITSASSESRGLSESVTGRKRARRIASVIASDPLNYTRAAYGVASKTAVKKPRKVRSDKGKPRKRTNMSEADMVLHLIKRGYTVTKLK